MFASWSEGNEIEVCDLAEHHLRCGYGGRRVLGIGDGQLSGRLGGRCAESVVGGYGDTGFHCGITQDQYCWNDDYQSRAKLRGAGLQKFRTDDRPLLIDHIAHHSASLHSIAQQGVGIDRWEIVHRHRGSIVAEGFRHF